MVSTAGDHNNATQLTLFTNSENDGSCRVGFSGYIFKYWTETTVTMHRYTQHEGQTQTQTDRHTQ